MNNCNKGSSLSTLKKVQSTLPLINHVPPDWAFLAYVILFHKLLCSSVELCVVF